MSTLDEKMALAVNDAMDDGSFEGGSLGDLSDPAPIETPEAVPEPVKEVAAAPEAVTPEVKTEIPAEKDELFEELGLKPRPDKKPNRIPYPDVKRIVDTQRGRERKKLTAEFDAKLAEATSKVNTYEERLKAVGEVEALILSNPERYLELLPQANPKFAELLKRGEVTPPAVTAVVPATPPPPNVTLADGSLTYDTVGLQKLMDWQAGQVKSKLEKEFTDRFGPMERDYKTQKLIDEQRPAVEAKLNAAEKWPLFTESRNEILAALQDPKDPASTLEAAYQRIVVPKLQANRDTMRADILKEIAAQPTKLGMSATPVAKVEAPTTLEEQMMVAMKADGLVK